MTPLSLLANMNISPLTVQRLGSEGWDMIRVNDVLNEKSSDAEVLQYARENDLVLITQDLDFSILLALGGYEKPSVITVRLENPNPESVFVRLVEVLEAMREELHKGCVLSVDETSARCRRLPIQD